MKKPVFTWTLAVAVNQCLFAQNTKVTQPADTTLNFKNYLFGEIAGSSLGLTVNYERFLSKSPGGFSVRAGVGFGVVPNIFGNTTQFYLSIPLGISYNIPISKNKHNFFELGGTYTFLGGSDAKTSNNGSIFGTTPAVVASDPINKSRMLGVVTGWRHTSVSGKTQIRLYVMPVLINVTDSNHSNTAIIGFSIGHRF